MHTGTLNVPAICSLDVLSLDEGGHGLHKVRAGQACLTSF